MPIDNVTWHTRVGIFYTLKSLPKIKLNAKKFPVLTNPISFSLIFFWNAIILHLTNVQHVLDRVLTEKSAKSFLCSITKLPKMVKTTIFLSLCISNLLMQCGDIEVNPGPKYSSLTFCHWNLNGLTAHDNIKISLLQAYVTQYNCDIICISETFLNSSIQNDDDRIKIDGYNLIRSDHPSDSKKGGVCIYYKEHISLIKRDDICTLDNCLVTEIRSQNEKCFLTCLYRSPSQSHDEFENFCIKFDILLSQINDELPICSVVTGDFNARCSRWWRNDITNFAGKEIDFLTSSAGYTQIIDKPTHVINKSKSCIDLIFCTNQNVISKYGVDASLFDKCHHNVIYGKINIRVPLPPVFIREVWNYSKADVQNIQKAILDFNWRKAFVNLFLLIQRLTFLMKHY